MLSTRSGVFSGNPPRISSRRTVRIRSASACQRSMWSGAFGKAANRAVPSRKAHSGTVTIVCGRDVPSAKHRSASISSNFHFRLGDRTAVAPTAQPFLDPAIHRFTHGLIVIVAGFDRDMADLRLLAEQAKPFAGVRDALGGLARAELKGVASRADDQECAGRDHGQKVARRGIGRLRRR